MISNWALTEHITHHLVRPRLGDIRPPALWPSEATSTTTNSYGETEVSGQCRRNTFLRYTVSQYAFDKTKYAHYSSLVEELHSVEQEPDRYMRWIWKAALESIASMKMVNSQSMRSIRCRDSAHIAFMPKPSPKSV